MMEGMGDSFEHGEAVAVVVGVLQSADDRLGRPDQPSQVLLAEARRGAKLVDLLGNSQVLPLAGQGRQALLTVLDVPPVKDSDRVCSLPVVSHYSCSLYVCLAGALL